MKFLSFCNGFLLAIFILLTPASAHAVGFVDVDISGVSTVKRSFQLLHPFDVAKSLKTCEDSYIEEYDNSEMSYVCKCRLTEASSKVSAARVAIGGREVQLPSGDYQTPTNEVATLKSFSNAGDLWVQVSHLNDCTRFSSVSPAIQEFIQDLKKVSVSVVLFRSASDPLETTPMYTETLIQPKAYEVRNSSTSWFDIKNCESNWQLIPLDLSQPDTFGQCSVVFPNGSDSTYYYPENNFDVFYTYTEVSSGTGYIDRGFYSSSIDAKKLVLLGPTYDYPKGLSYTLAVLANDTTMTNTWQESETAVHAFQNYLATQPEHYLTDAQLTPNANTKEIRVAERRLDPLTLNNLENLRANWNSLYNRSIVSFYNDELDYAVRELKENDAINNQVSEDASFTLENYQTSEGPLTLTLIIRASSLEIVATVEESYRYLSWDEIEPAVGELFYQYVNAPVGIRMFK